jgi:hypothetical protein
MAAIWRISYLAKARGKGYKPVQTKNFATSRIRLITGNKKAPIPLKINGALFVTHYLNL